MKKLAIIAASLLMFVVVGCSSSGPDMKEGKWEVTSKTELKGIPMQMPAMTFTQCMTKEDMVPQGSQEAQSNCETAKNKISGSNVSWEMICEDGGMKTMSKGSITYNGKTFNGTVEMSISGAMAMEGTTTMSGKYMGPCK